VPEQVEDVSGADRARADAEWGGTPAALSNSGATWHDLAGDQQTRRGAAPARPRAAAPRPLTGDYGQPLDVEALARGAQMSFEGIAAE